MISNGSVLLVFVLSSACRGLTLFGLCPQLPFEGTCSSKCSEMISHVERPIRELSFASRRVSIRRHFKRGLRVVLLCFTSRCWAFVPCSVSRLEAPVVPGAQK